MSTRGPYRVVGYKPHDGAKKPLFLIVHSDREWQTATCLEEHDAEVIARLLNQGVTQ